MDERSIGVPADAVDNEIESTWVIAPDPDGSTVPTNTGGIEPVAPVGLFESLAVVAVAPDLRLLWFPLTRGAFAGAEHEESQKAKIKIRAIPDSLRCAKLTATDSTREREELG